MRTLSNRADLISGGDALVEVGLPPGIDVSRMRVDVDVPTELHLFPSGGHGFGIRGAVGDGLLWPRYALTWMKANGILP